MRTLLGLALVAVLALAALALRQDNRTLSGVGELCADPAIGGLVASPATAEVGDRVSLTPTVPTTGLPELVARALAGDCAAFLVDGDTGTVSRLTVSRLTVPPRAGTPRVTGSPHLLGTLHLRVPPGMLPRTYDVCDQAPTSDCALLTVVALPGR